MKIDYRSTEGRISTIVSSPYPVLCYLHLYGVIHQPSLILECLVVARGSDDVDGNHFLIRDVIEIDIGGVDKMVHPFALFSGHLSRVEGETLVHLVHIVPGASVLDVPVIVDRLSYVPLEIVRLQGVSFDEEGIPSPVGVEIIEGILGTLGDNAEGGIAEAILSTLLQSLRYCAR